MSMRLGSKQFTFSKSSSSPWWFSWPSVPSSLMCVRGCSTPFMVTNPKHVPLCYYIFNIKLPVFFCHCCRLSHHHARTGTRSSWRWELTSSGCMWPVWMCAWGADKPSRGPAVCGRTHQCSTPPDFEPLVMIQMRLYILLYYMSAIPFTYTPNWNYLGGLKFSW